MKINNVALPISLAVILTGCVPNASNRNITAIEVVKPAIGQSATAYMGDPIITSATGFKTDVLELGAANGALSSIAAGTYCSEGNGIYRNYHNPQAVALKNLYGQIGNYVDYVSYDAAKNEISPPNGTSYTASEISIKRVPDGLCRVSNSLVKTIEYNGNAGGVMKFTYREFANDMARAAFIMDKIMHKMGLHGKSFIPLIMGFGCNVPAIMASRTIENRKSRLITMLVNPLMSCSARLPIYLLLVGAFFPKNGSLVLLAIYAIGIALAVIMARLFSRFLVKGDDTPFVMELPPYRMPTMKSIFRHTWEKGAQYLKKMGGIIMIASIIIWFLGYYPDHDAYPTQAEQQENSYIGQIGQAVEPVLKPLGFDWKLSIGLLSGVGAKELVVSTLGVLYTNDADADVVSLAERIPITPLAAFSYMLFVLIYFPCIATLVAIKQESGSWKWAIFTAGYTTALAWLVSFAVYQIGGMFL